MFTTRAQSRWLLPPLRPLLSSRASFPRGAQPECIPWKLCATISPLHFESTFVSNCSLVINKNDEIGREAQHDLAYEPFLTAARLQRSLRRNPRAPRRENRRTRRWGDVPC